MDSRKPRKQNSIIRIKTKKISESGVNTHTHARTHARTHAGTHARARIIRERDRDRETETERQRQTDRQRQRNREIETDRWTDRQQRDR